MFTLGRQENFLGPKECYQIQADLGTDIAMVLDECPPPSERIACESTVQRTIRWAKEFKIHADNDGFIERGHHIFGIIQGSIYDDFRIQCAEELADLNFPGYAVGVSVGEPEEEMIRQVSGMRADDAKRKTSLCDGCGYTATIITDDWVRHGYV